MSGSEAQHVDALQERMTRLEELLESRDDGALRAFLAELHPSDVADVIEHLEDDAERVRILDLLPADLASEALAEMEAHQHPEDILFSLDPKRISELLEELHSDDAADLIGELEPHEQAQVLSTLEPVDASELRELIAYPEDSAGGIMTTEVVAISIHLTAGEAIQEVRRQGREVGDDFYNIFVVDLLRRLQGQVGLQELVLADPDQRISEMVEPILVSVPVDMDQEEVGRLIGRYNEPSVPVVGPRDTLMGRITWDDVLDVMEAEQTEDILRLAGGGREEEVQGEWLDAAKARLPWLVLNVVTASLGAAVVLFFESTIAALAILASIMPVIAGLAGTAGTQSLAVTVRRLALTPEHAARRWGVAAKELLVGMMNGAAIGIVLGGVVHVLFNVAGLGTESGMPPGHMLGLVVMLAMWANLIVASFMGAFIPVVLERLGADPAVASSMFVTAMTDLTGFFLLLGLATHFLL